MLKKLLCTLNLGHHWLAETDQDGTFRRHCIHCGKVHRRSTLWSGRLAASDRPHDPGDDSPFPASPFP